MDKRLPNSKRGFMQHRKFRLLPFLLLAILTVTCTAVVSAQQLVVTGKVSDNNGQPLSGVSVVSGTNSTGTSTNQAGVYSLRADASASLTFTYVGYETLVVRVNGKTQLDVSLTPGTAQLNDVVVVGYGTQKRKDVTGAITTIKLEGSAKSAVPFVNPLEAIQGTAGINVGPSTSAGANPNIVVRGQNSINASTSPLIILDGVIFNGNLNEINMNDISTFDILKDASSAAIYGSRSANGVVIITTKRGKSEKPVISFNSYYGIQNWTRTPDMRKGADFVQWRKDNLSIRGTDITDLTKVFSPLELKAYNEGHTLNWFDEVTQYAPIQNYELAVSGRTKNLNYYFSGGYLNQKGVLANDNFKKPNLTIKLENTITNWLSYGVNAYYSARDYSGTSPDMYMATYMSPYSYRYLDGTNNSILQRYPAGNTSLFNPYWGNVNTSQPGYYDDDLEKYTSARGTGFVNLKLPYVPGLNFRFNVTASRNTTERAYFHHEFGEVNTLVAAEVSNPAQFLAKANGYQTNATGSTWLVDNLLTYTKSFGDHNFDVLAGYTRDNYTVKTVRFNGSNFASIGTTVLGYNALQYATTQTGVTNYSQYSNVGYIGRFNYNYKQRYYATFNFRRDGYSAFSDGHKFGSFPGGSVAWAISEENFMKRIAFINHLKLRASYGRTGNQGIDPYATQATVDLGYTVFGSTSTAYTIPSSLANKTLSWEKTAALNFGLDYTLFNSRVSGNIDVYSSKTTDQLLVRSLPTFTGYNSVNTNLGEVHNQGIEISLNTVNIKSAHGFNWTTGVSFWLNRNKLVHLYGLDANGDGKEDDDLGNSLFIGKSLGAVYDYTVEGVVQSTDLYYLNKFQNATGLPLFQPGDLKIRDINNDGVINAADRSVIGYAKENFNVNLSNTFSYKNFQLYFSINSIIGGGKNNYFISTNTRSLDPGAVLPQSGNWLNLPYWMPGNENSKYPRPNYSNPFGYGFYQSRTFARIQNMAFSYTFPAELLQRLKINDLRAYVSGTNLLTLTGWTGLDPANGAQIGGNGGSTNSAVNTSPPLMRTISFGINLGF